jgi:hypothetical protein
MITMTETSTAPTSSHASLQVPTAGQPCTGLSALLVYVLLTPIPRGRDILQISQEVVKPERLSHQPYHKARWH